jgi:hypothetical protein
VQRQLYDPLDGAVQLLQRLRQTPPELLPGTERGPRPPPPRGSSAWVRGVVGWRACLHSGAGVVARVMMSQLASGMSGTEPAGATGRGSSVWPERAGRAVGRDARLTLWAHSPCAVSRESCSDLVFSVTRSGRHLSDDPPCGVRGDPGAGGQGCLTCGLWPSSSASPVSARPTSEA